MLIILAIIYYLLNVFNPVLWHEFKVKPSYLISCFLSETSCRRKSIWEFLVRFCISSCRQRKDTFSFWVLSAFDVFKTFLMIFRTTVYGYDESFKHFKQKQTGFIVAENIFSESYLKSPSESVWKSSSLPESAVCYSLLQSISHPLLSSGCRATAWILFGKVELLYFRWTFLGPWCGRCCVERQGQ